MLCGGGKIYDVAGCRMYVLLCLERSNPRLACIKVLVGLEGASTRQS